MTTEQMKYFLETARLLNMTEAAKSLYVAQPTLSRQISLLEKEIGTPLFHRNKGKLTLTGSGQFLYSEFKHLYGRIFHLIDTARTLSGREEESITIGVVEGHFYDLGLIPALERFSERYPEINFWVEFRSGSDLRSALQNGRIDLLCGEKELVYEENETNAIVSLGRKRQKIMMSRKHPLACKEVLTPEDVSRLELSIPASVSQDSFLNNDPGALPPGARISKVATSYDSNMAYVITNKAVAVSYGDEAVLRAYPEVCLKEFVGSNENEIVLCYLTENGNSAIPKLIGCFQEAKG